MAFRQIITNQRDNAFEARSVGADAFGSEVNRFLMACTERDPATNQARRQRFGLELSAGLGNGSEFAPNEWLGELLICSKP
ncbi:MAG TPA: hypothetical protein DCF63_00155 [Planctomycetaceae bacterium]|nr:hypothetical protein [Planctomycetaceae bacterium]